MIITLGRSAIILLLLLLPLQSLAFEPQLPGKKDRCPVCGMFVAPYPDWIATIVFKDEKQLFFDGCKDLFRYYFKLSSESGTDRRGRIEEIYVTDYYSTRLVPIADVFFVLGSDVYGPMGKELIPIVGQELAETFMRDHSGTGMFRFENITPELLPAD
ncbi:MAG: nitrous oxide reductase accessory protein NosL [Deltaproteobacteria bacterium]|nr:nitrous oxide reductase accessory protein NosL [Deltaproteobacteria bacterium]